MIGQTVRELLEDQVQLDIEGIDRLYLNAYQPRLQTGGGVVGFFREHRGAVVASTTLMVPQEQLTRVAGLDQTRDAMTRIAGAPLGALLVTLLPIQGILAIDVATALLAVVPLLFIGAPIPQIIFGGT